MGRSFWSEVRSGPLPFKWLMQEAGRSLPPFSEGLPSHLIQSRTVIIGSNDATRRRYCKGRRAYAEQSIKLQEKQALWPHGPPPPSQRGGVRAPSEASRAASEASATAAWAATAIPRGDLRAQSEALNAASEANATAA